MSETRAHQRIRRDAEQQPRHDLFQHLIAHLSDRPGAEQCKDKGDRHRQPHLRPVHQSGAPVVVNRQHRAPGALHLVCAQRHLWRQTRPQQCRHGDQPPTACDGVDEPRAEASAKKERDRLAVHGRDGIRAEPTRQHRFRLAGRKPPRAAGTHSARISAHPADSSGLAARSSQS